MQVLDQDREKRIYSNFVDSVQSDETKRVYKHYLRTYMKFLRIWVEHENKEDEFTNQLYSQLIDMPSNQIFESVKLFILDKRKRELSSSSMNGPLSALKLFYDMNDIETIRWKKLQRFKGEETEEHEDRAYTREEIQTLLNVSDLRLKATVLLCASTGMRIGAFNTSVTK